MPHKPGIAPAILTIDLNAIKANWLLLKDKSKSGNAAAVVKADAYGLGVQQVTSALASVGCNTFFTATIEEAQKIRQLGNKSNIAVFYGTSTQEDAEVCIENHIAPVLNHLGQLKVWKDTILNRKPTDNRLPPKAWLHIDTGMTRLGFPKKDLDKLLKTPEIIDEVPIVGIMSHLSCSEQIQNPINLIQLDRFVNISNNLSKILPEKIIYSLANSSGIFLGPDYHFDISRPGAAIYGINPCPGIPNPMRNVILLQGKILQIQYVDRHQAVGYGSSHIMSKRGRVATLAIGYADGYFRSSGGIAHAQLGKYHLPVIGRVSMDLITLDVSNVPENECHEGSLVTLLDSKYTIDDFAKDSGTIGYEVLTSLGTRYHRVWSESSPQEKS